MIVNKKTQWRFLFYGVLCDNKVNDWLFRLAKLVEIWLRGVAFL